jgi:hypothetical protein
MKEEGHDIWIRDHCSIADKAVDCFQHKQGLFSEAIKKEGQSQIQEIIPEAL